MKNLIINISNYLYALKRYMPANTKLHNKIQKKLKKYQLLNFISERLIYESKIDYENLSLANKKKLENIEELKTVFNFDKIL